MGVGGKLCLHHSDLGSKLFLKELNMKKETVEEWLLSNKVTKVPLNYAEGATLNGSVCAGRFSKGLSGGHGEHRFQSKNPHFSKDKEIKGYDQEKASIKKHHKKLNKITKGFKGRATEKQKEFMRKNGLKVYVNMSRKKAFKKIASFIAIAKKVEKGNRMLRAGFSDKMKDPKA